MRIQPGYLPTPREIVEACTEIRRRWSQAERQRRMVGYSREDFEPRWFPPRIDSSLCTARIRKEVSDLTA